MNFLVDAPTSISIHMGAKNNGLEAIKWKFAMPWNTLDKMIAELCLCDWNECEKNVPTIIWSDKQMKTIQINISKLRSFWFLIKWLNQCSDYNIALFRIIENDTQVRGTACWKNGTEPTDWFRMKVAFAGITPLDHCNSNDQLGKRKHCFQYSPVAFRRLAHLVSYQQQRYRAWNVYNVRNII